MIFHVPIVLLTDDVAINAHLQCLEHCLQLVPDTAVLAVLFEKPLAQPGKDFSNIRQRFRGKVAGLNKTPNLNDYDVDFSEKAVEYFEMWILNPDDIKLILPRCERRKAQLAEEREQRRKAELERIKLEQAQKQEEERRREQEIREGVRKAEEEARRDERQKREQAERDAQLDLFVGLLVLFCFCELLSRCSKCRGFRRRRSFCSCLFIRCPFSTELIEIQSIPETNLFSAIRKGKMLKRVEGEKAQ